MCTVTTSCSRSASESCMLQKKSPRLPPEICDRMIALLSKEDTATVLNCARVCSDWLPASRLRLFSNPIRLDPHQYDLFVTTILRSDSVYMHQWLGYIADLTVSDVPGTAASQAKRTQRMIHDFAGRLPSLQSLSLYESDWKRLPPHPSAFATLSTFPALRTLHLSSCALPSFSVLRSILTASPRLAVLELWEVNWPPVRHATPFATRAAPAIATLEVVGLPRNCLDSLCAWLALTPTARSIHEVSLHAVGGPWPPGAVQFLRASARSIQSLARPTLSADLASALQQLSSRHLRTLLLYGVFVRKSSAPQRNDAKHAGSPASSVGGVALESTGVELLDPVLAGDNFTRLKVVSFLLESKDGRGEEQSWTDVVRKVESEIRGKLPRLSGRTGCNSSLVQAVYKCQTSVAQQTTHHASPTRVELRSESPSRGSSAVMPK
ncbi:hypothetical protein C8Q80DRAFT_1295147 [Daedaleopsis nitida]|nr:hypothetical protein C8Q80DRAFT_1295147 [Daedaleopsis nitida]